MPILLRSFLSRCVRHGHLHVETANGRRFVVGDGSGSAIGIRFADRLGPLELVLDPSLALGELFTDGRLTVHGCTLYELLDLFGRNLKDLTPPGLGKFRMKLRTALGWLRMSISARRARQNVSHHYDLDERLYRLFLDGDMQYSCAYFERPGQSLSDAQLTKKQHIAAKLLMKPGLKTLDIGSGWGGLGLFLAERCGAVVTGITLSPEQLAVATARARQQHHTPRAKFQLQDYRSMSGNYDRIVSVGMFEHVGAADYDTYFECIARLLDRNGVALVHSIGRSDGPSATNRWMSKYIFPGGYIPALSEVLPAIEKSGLIATDIEILRLHYAATLAAWRQRFLARRDEAASMLGERFCRMWEFYLAASEVGFRYGGLIVFQIQLAKLQDTVPLTRNYIRDAELQFKQSEAQAAWPNIAAE